MPPSTEIEALRHVLAVAAGARVWVEAMKELYEATGDFSRMDADVVYRGRLHSAWP
jgi:hypothetical protein